MKKTAAAAIAAALVLTTSAAFAAPVEFDGDVKAHYRWNTETGESDTEGGKFTVRLNAKMELDKNVSAYARFAAQTLSGDHIGADFNKSSNSIATIDQYGFIYKNADWSYKIGRQGASITPTASLLSSESYIGKDVSFLTGVVATGKSGVTSLQIVVGNQEDDLDVSDSNRVYSVHASVSPADNWTLGATLAKYEPKGQSDSNYWGVDVGYTSGKASFIADYLKSDANTNDTAHVFGVDYAFDDKNSVSVYAHKTEAASHIYTDWDPGQKGYYYSYNHNFDKETSFNLFYKDNKYLTGGENTSLRTTVTYKF